MTAFVHPRTTPIKPTQLYNIAAGNSPRLFPLSHVPSCPSPPESLPIAPIHPDSQPLFLPSTAPRRQHLSCDDYYAIRQTTKAVVHPQPTFPSSSRTHAEKQVSSRKVPKVFIARLPPPFLLFRHHHCPTHLSHLPLHTHLHLSPLSPRQAYFSASGDERTAWKSRNQDHFPVK